MRSLLVFELRIDKVIADAFVRDDFLLEYFVFLHEKQEMLIDWMMDVRLQIIDQIIHLAPSVL